MSDTLIVNTWSDGEQKSLELTHGHNMGSISVQDGDTSAIISLTRHEAAKLRDALNDWIENV